MGPDGLSAYLRTKPEDFVIDWYVDNMNADTPWDVSWVDVLFEDHLAWTITSGLLDDDYHDDLLWPPDLVAHVLLDPSQPDPFVWCVPTALNTPVPDETITEIRQARATASPDAYWMGAPAWSAAEVNRAIEDWCLRHVGRPVQARWDADHGPSPALTQARAVLDGMRAGIEPTYLVHPGEKEGGTGYSIYASEQVMDILMRGLLESNDDRP